MPLLFFPIIAFGLYRAGSCLKSRKKRQEILPLFCSDVAPTGMICYNTDRRCHTVGGFPPFDS